ncbi:hypothetical protein OSH10_08505 [Kaistia defluvii]|uniref:hypothetical protein n=1 Tax=Kaistia defluvii TaxID=410841 RepID=UPI00225161E6|nr:hypothetical protein [Kaistia defluvii]MCX5518475.1 hypothetical protein [Kaistia defluvii]
MHSPNTPLRVRRNSRNETALEVARRTGSVPNLMAAEMLDRASIDGSCSEDFLKLCGFTQGEILMYGPQARQLAERKANERIAA